LKRCGNQIKYRDRVPGEVKSESSYAVPIDAMLIFSLNLPVVFNEIAFDSLIKSQAYKDRLAIGRSSNPLFSQIFSDPKTCGIDVNKKATFYLNVGDDDKEVYTATILCVKDESKLQPIITSTSSGKIEKSKFYSSRALGNNNFVAWNPSFIMFLTTTAEYDDQKVVFEQVFNPSAEKYFDKKPEYLTHFEKSKEDASFWWDLEAYSENQLHATGKPGEVPKMILDGNYVYGDINLKKGAFDADINIQMNNVVKEALEKIFEKGADPLLRKFLPQSQPSFIANLSLDIDGMFSVILKDAERKVEARNSLAPYGLMIEDIGKAISGDVMFAGFPNDTTTKTSVLFGLKIKDRNEFDKLLRIMQSVGKIEKVDENMYKMNTGVIPFYPMLATYPDQLQRLIIKDDYAFVSLDKKIIDAMHPTQTMRSDSAIYYNTSLGGTDFLAFYASPSFKETASFSTQFSMNGFNVHYNGDRFIFNANLLDPNKHALLQILNL
jgi:hypothetical protein